MGKVSAELGQRVYTDANIVIYAVEGFAAYLDQIRALMTAMNTGEITIVTSELTLAEVLVKPLKDQNPAIQQAYKTFLAPTPALEVIPISRDILEEAAQWRATTKLKLPDAIHLATALRSKCDSFLTNLVRRLLAWGFANFFVALATALFDGLADNALERMKI